MAADSRLAVVVFASFILWLPALGAFLRGDLDPGAAGMRLLGAAGVVCIGMAVLVSIVTSYRPQAEPTVGHGGEPPRRRAVDPRPESARDADAPEADPAEVTGSSIADE